MNYVLQRNPSNQNNWANEVARIRSQYSLHQSDEEIKLLSKNKWKSIVADYVEKYVYSLLCDQTSLQSKTKFIKRRNALQQQKYVQELPAPTARRAFEVRLGMFDIKHNYKNKYSPNLKCWVCNKQDESLQHFFECENYISHLRIDKQFTFMWIYEEDVEKINKSVQIIEQILKIRNELINEQ